MITFSKVRYDFIESPGLTPTEKLILVYLYGRMRKDGKPWIVDPDQVSAALHLSLYATDKALGTLKDKGWITDNRKPVRGSGGRIRRPRSVVIESRRGDVVAPDPTFPQVAPKVETPSTVNLASYELRSDERVSELPHDDIGYCFRCNTTPCRKKLRRGA